MGYTGIVSGHHYHDSTSNHTNSISPSSSPVPTTKRPQSQSGSPHSTARLGKQTSGLLETLSLQQGPSLSSSSSSLLLLRNSATAKNPVSATPPTSATLPTPLLQQHPAPTQAARHVIHSSTAGSNSNDNNNNNSSQGAARRDPATPATFKPSLVHGQANHAETGTSSLRRPSSSSSMQGHIATLSLTKQQQKASELSFVRSEEERLDDPDRLNLDAQHLQGIPKIHHEQQLRLLNLQNNAIQRITNLDYLPSLIFLDLYNNKVQNIFGVEFGRNLRVLMLGRNMLKSLEGIKALIYLDVLDVHANMLTSIHELSLVTTLRVLNLASNDIEDISPLSSLSNLVELNLRKNKVSELINFTAHMPYLQRLFLSDNAISALEGVLGHNSLAELALDGNAGATSQSHYRETVITTCQNLRLLDQRRVSQEERRMAGITLRRIKEKQRLAEDMERMKRLREGEISRIATCWEKFKSYTIQTVVVYESLLAESREAQEDTLGFAWLTSDRVHIYGHLDAFFNATLPANSRSLVLEHVHFATVLDNISKIKRKFLSNLSSLVINDCNVTHLFQLAGLEGLALTSLTLDPAVEPIGLCKFWRSYTIRRLASTGLAKLNGEHVASATPVTITGSEADHRDKNPFKTLEAFCAKVPINQALSMPTFPLPISQEDVDEFKERVQSSLHHTSAAQKRNNKMPTYSQGQIMRLVRDREAKIARKAERAIDKALNGLKLERELSRVWEEEKNRIEQDMRSQKL